MFENKVETTKEQKQSRAILWFGSVAVLLIAAVVVLLARYRPQPAFALDNAERPGAAAFEAYKDKLEIEIIDKITHPNMVGMFQVEVKARLHNRGDRTLTGVEIAGKMLDMDDKSLSERLSFPIPRVREEPLKPGESVAFSVKVDAPAKVSEGDVKDVIVELRALRF